MNKKERIKSKKTTSNKNHSEEIDVLKLYLEDIKKYKILSDDEEKALKEICLKGTEEEKIKAREKLINGNLRLVVSEAIKFKKKFEPKSLKLIDLIQEGNVGLVTAFEKFQFEKFSENNKFSTYAIFHIQDKIRKAFYNNDKDIRKPIYQYEQYYKVTKVINEYKKENNDIEPTYKYISKQLNISEKKVKDILLSKDDYVFSYNKKVGTEEEDEEFLNLIQDKSKKEGEEKLPILQKERKEKILNSLVILSEMEKDIVVRRVGLYDEPEKLKDIAIDYNCTEGRINQLERQAFYKLARRLGKDLLNY